MRKQHGVGIIGAGAVTQAIHLPALASLADRLRVTHVVDVAGDLAETVARRVGARAGTDVGALLDDPDVDIVAVNSPHGVHADQIVAACAAGVKGILCEKPLAVSRDEAARIADACATSGTPLVVGAMHTWDPAYVAASRAWDNLADTATLARSVIYLPDNAEMIDVATELVVPAQSPSGLRAENRTSRADALVETMASGVLGLAIHNTPLMRQFVPAIDNVSYAAVLAPWGYSLTMHGDERTVQMIGLLPGRWRPDWTVDVWGADNELHVAFTPSYVQSGSAHAVLASADASTTWCYPTNGYQAEWAHLADVVEGRAELAIPLASAVDDLVYALDINDAAARALRAELAQG